MVIFDLETGGVKTEHPVIQLAAIAVDGDLSELNTFQLKLKFDPKRCDPEALVINHYRPEDWTDAVSPQVAIRQFDAFARPYADVTRMSKAGRPYKIGTLAGYNAVSFDIPRLRALYGETAFFPFSYLTRDVLQRVLFWFDEHGLTLDNYKLSTVAAHFGLNVDDAHDALADCRLTLGVLRAMRGTVDGTVDKEARTA